MESVPPYNILYFTDPWKEYDYLPMCTDTASCHCFQDYLLQSNIPVTNPTVHYEPTDEMINVLEVLAYKGYWVYIYRIMMLLPTTMDCLRFLMHIVCDAADNALEWSCSLDREKYYTAGCIICDGYTFRSCNDGHCWECIEYKTHDCDDWHYKYNNYKKRRTTRKYLTNANSIVCSVCNVTSDLTYMTSDVCYVCEQCNTILCTECFQSGQCICQNSYDGAMLTEFELVMKALMLCGICTTCIRGNEECICHQAALNGFMGVTAITDPSGQ